MLSPRALMVMKVFIAVSLMCSAVSAWAIYARFQDTNQRRVENAAVWHAVICQIEQFVVESKDMGRTQRQLTLKFYDGLLVNQVHTTGCGFV